MPLSLSCSRNMASSPRIYVSELQISTGSQGHRSGSCMSRMDEDTAKAKQAGDQSQTLLNSEKAEPEVPKPDEAKKLIQFMENHYEEIVARVQSFDEFYHAIFELIEKFCEERGQFQYKIVDKETLENAYKKHHKTEGELKKEEFVAISREVLGLKSFSFGKAAVEIAMFLFGAPVCAVVAKRVLPGLGWLSEDVVVPLATSGTVAYLIKSKRL